MSDILREMCKSLAYYQSSGRLPLGIQDLERWTDHLERVEVERDRLRDALRHAAGVMQDHLDGTDHCGDPEYECPLQDAHKDRYDWTLAGCIKLVIDPALSPTNQEQSTRMLTVREISQIRDAGNGQDDQEQSDV